MADPYAAPKPAPGDTEYDAAVKIVSWMLRNEEAYEALQAVVNSQGGTVSTLEGQVAENSAALAQTATPTTSGLMSAADKAKLDGIETGATRNISGGDETPVFRLTASVTLQPQHNGAYLRMEGASAQTITIPKGWSGERVIVRRRGAGTVTVTVADSATMYLFAPETTGASASVTIPSQMATLVLQKIDVDAYDVEGVTAV